MRSKKIPVRDLGKEIRALGAKVPHAVVRGLREGALMLGGALVQVEIARAAPQPVDQGQYKASWSTRDVEGGAVVHNLSKHGAFVERGRRPGRAPPLSPIREWVRRKGIWKGRYNELRAEARARKAAFSKFRREARRATERANAGRRFAAAVTGTRYVSLAAAAAKEKRAIDKALGRRTQRQRKMGPALPKGFKRSQTWRAGVREDKKRANASARATQKRNMQEQAIFDVARGVQENIAWRGTKGHGILFHAIRRLQPKLPGIIRRSIRELQP